MILITSLAAILITQFIKLPIAYLTKKGRPHVNIVTSTGGMPSSHSAAVSSLITSLIFVYGFRSPYVAIATVFGVIVMFDSMGVRRQSGEQGIIVDKIYKNLSENKHDGQFKDYNDSQDVLDNINPTLNDYAVERYESMIIKKYLGHKPSEVIVGVIIGALVSIVFRFLFFKYY